MTRVEQKSVKTDQLHGEEIFSNGDDYFTSLIQDLNKASKSIDLESYIFDDDALGQKIAKILAGAHLKGLKVRVLVDGCGSLYWGGITKKILEDAGVPSQLFHPLPWHTLRPNHPLKKHPFLTKALFGLLNLNARNHRKTCIIDHKIAYIGSINISCCHTSQANKHPWRDSAIKLTHIDLSDLEDAFERAWLQSSEQSRLKKTITRLLLPDQREPVIRLNNTRYRRRALYKRMLSRISKAKNRVWITSAYFVPDTFLLKRLTRAAASGVDVRILLPKVSDVPFMKWVAAEFYPSLLSTGVKIYEYHPSMLHAKLLIIDDWYMLGSSNLNHRSMFHDLEVDVEVQQENSKKTLVLQFKQDLKDSNEITEKYLKDIPFYQSIAGKIVLYLKYWI